MIVGADFKTASIRKTNIIYTIKIPSNANVFK